MFLYYFLIFVMPLSNHRIWSAQLNELTIFKYLGGACFIYALFHLGTHRTSPPLFREWPGRLFLLLTVLAVFSSLMQSSLIQLSHYDPLLSFLSFVLLFFITIAVVDSQSRLRTALMAMVASVGFASLYIFREWQKYASIYENFRPGTAATGDPNEFAVSAVLCLPLALYMVLEKGRKRWERFFGFGCLVMTLWAVLMGASRGGFVGLIASFFYVVLRSKRRIRNLILAAGLLVPGVLFLPSSPLQRMLHPTWVDDQSVRYHKTAWNGGVNMIKAHPLVGVGLSNFKPLVSEYEDSDEKVKSLAHNTYLEMGAELGIPGLLVFVGILVSSFYNMVKVRRQAIRAGDRFMELAALSLQGGLIGYMVSANFVSVGYDKTFWLVVFLSVCMPSLVKVAAVEQKETEFVPQEQNRKAVRRRRSQELERELASRSMKTW